MGDTDDDGLVTAERIASATCSLTISRISDIPTVSLLLPLERAGVDEAVGVPVDTNDDEDVEPSNDMIEYDLLLNSNAAQFCFSSQNDCWSKWFWCTCACSSSMQG